MTTPAQREAVARIVEECRPPPGLRMSPEAWREAIVGEIIAAYEAAAWQPIETAPVMTTVILFALTEPMSAARRNWHIGSGFYHESEGCWWWEGRALKSYDWQPTHWQPLPTPPKEPTDA